MVGNFKTQFVCLLTSFALFSCSFLQCKGTITLLTSAEFRGQVLTPAFYALWIYHWHLSFKALVSENSLDVNYTTVSSYPYMYIIYIHDCVDTFV